MKRPFPAKWRGFCPRCGGVIRPGSPVVNFGTGKTMHAACGREHELDKLGLIPAIKQ